MAEFETLLPPSAAKQERDIEAAIARAADFTPNFAAMWNPAAAPSSVLPWLAWAYSVDNWSAEWPEDAKRALTEQSYFIHRYKGTVGAVRRAITSITGGEYQLREWYQTGGPVHTFDLTVWAHNILTSSGPIIGPDLYAQLRQAVDAAKPVRSHYELRIGAKFGSQIDASSALTTVARPLTTEIAPLPRTEFSAQLKPALSSAINPAVIIKTPAESASKINYQQDLAISVASSVTICAYI